MWIFPVARLCVAQDSRYADSILGKLVMQSRLKLDTEQFNQCARSKQWVPDTVCTELMSLNLEKDLSRSNLERLGEKYAPQLSILNVAAPYVMDAAEAHGSGKSMPQCP